MIKAARALTGLDQALLAALTGVSRKTVTVVENTISGKVDARRRAVLEKIRRESESLGIEFRFGGDEEGDGVSLKREL